MATIAETVTTNATEYLGYAPKTLTVNLAIEKFKDIRNYPSSYTEAMIETDMTNNISKITMAVVELDAKEGGEGENAHSENGISRTYGNYGMPEAYKSVAQFATVI